MLLDKILCGIWLPVGMIWCEMWLPVGTILCEMWLSVGTILFGTIRFDKEVDLFNFFNTIPEWEDILVDDNDN